MLNLRHFFALPTIEDTGSLSAAAERRHLSQSALTQALNKLEVELGAKLFERVGFGVATTPAGQLVVSRARRAMHLLSVAERELSGKLPPIARPKRLHRLVTASQLRALGAVVASGGYSTAGRQLGLSQPTIYRAIKRLEQVLGLTLFVRSDRGIEPTEAAEILARKGELVMAEVRQAHEEVGELLGQAASRIAVGSLPLARSEFLPGAITQLLFEYPDARVSLLDGPYVEQLHALRHGHIDWLIGALRDPNPGNDVVQEPLFEEPLAVVVRPGHPSLSHGHPTPKMLSELDWVAPRPSAPSRKLFTAYFKRHDLPEPERIIECGSLIATQGLVQQSDRAALLSPLQARPYVRSGHLAVLAPKLTGSDRAIGVTTRVDWEPTRVQRSFIETLRRLAVAQQEKSVPET